MMKYNLHTHTARCNHATGTDREYVEAAITAGMKVLGFTDHCPQFFPDRDYYSYFRMFPEQAHEYVSSVRALQKEYAADIRLLLGFETEYYPETYDRFAEFAAQLGLDYMIMGQHFVGNEYDEGSYYAADGARGERFLTQYVDQVKEGLEKGVFTYIAHPDIVWYKGKNSFYDEKMTELCLFARERGIPLEYNILGHINKRSYPEPRFWKIAAATGNSVVLGYDAHSPEALLQTKPYEECLQKLNALGLKPMRFEDIRLVKPAFGEVGA